jgi:general secretion pathway protein D
LTDVLKAQGYFASEGRPGAVSLFTIEETDSIIVFANDEETLAFVAEWVKNLDQPIKQAEGDNVFYYQVKNTSAEEVADSINELLAGGAAQRAAGGSNSAGSSASSTGTATSIVGQASRLVVDFNRNALLFYGSNSEWLTMLPTIEKLDQTPLQVLVEVVIAEVTLSDNFEYGVDWAINNVNSNLTGSNPRDSVSIQNGVLNFFPITSSGYTRAVINLLESDTRATILQTPRILVRSGQEATINVGLDIPVVTSTQASTEGNSIVQDVSYRKTGTNLSVKPIVYGGGQVDIELNQEVSRSTAGSGSAGNPTIFSRSISTTLSIKDGGSVLVGGLISSSGDTTNNNVPLLGDLPLIGNLFASKSDQSERTELMILIAPYVVKGSDDSSAITDAFKRQLTLHDQ